MHNPWPIIGNEPRLVELESDLNNQKLSHAYLFAGPSGVGKFTAAKFFTNLTLCENSACGECPTCRQIKTNTLADLTIADQLWVEGINEDWELIGQSSNFGQLHRSKTPKAKTDTLGIEDVSEILSRIHDTHTGYRVILIRRVERLTREAANHLLKILEEPPPRTVFVLTTDNLPLLPETLVSRCRILQFGNVNPSAIAKKLSETWPQLTDQERTRIVNFSTGKPGRAIRLASDPELLTRYAEYFRQLKTLLEKPDTTNCLNFAEVVTKTLNETAKFLEAATYFLRSLLLSRLKQPAINSRYNTKKLISMIRSVNQTRDLVSKNVNARLAVENLLLTI